jgi:two-component system chemotaxis sensor kinase CheA
MPPSGIDPEELKVFLQEAEEHLQVLDEDIIRLEKEAGNTDLLQGIFRAAHTLKGSSGMLGFTRMAELTHHMEDVLDRVRRGVLGVTPELVDALLESLDGLKALMHGVIADGDDNVDISAQVAMLRAAADGPAAASAGGGAARATLAAAIDADASARTQIEAAAGHGLHVWKVKASLAPGTAWAAVRCFQVITELSLHGEIVVSMPSLDDIQAEKAADDIELVLITSAPAEELRAVVEEVEDIIGALVEPYDATLAAPADLPAAAGPADARGRGGDDAARIEPQQSVRIDVDKLDALMNLVGELVIDRTRVTQLARTLQARYHGDATVQSLEQISAHIGKVVEDLNDGMMQARMLPIGTLFSKFPRLVRDVARSTGKQVEFETEGEGTEIDRAVIEKIKDPLIHLLRNAVDHGIELPDVRHAAGKPEAGTIRLAATHDQGRILITLTDDGKGIDTAAVKAKAVERGMIAAEAAERMTEQEALDLIFESGLSTAARTTDISGRGVGMDVVRSSIQALNGVVTVESRPGGGSVFTLQLPLTLATFRGLLVESSSAVYAIPLSYVQETGRLEPRQVQNIVNREVINLRGTVMPLYRLSGIAELGAEAGSEDFMVVVRVGDRPTALAVDRLMDQQEVVVKSLGSTIGRARGVAGASILGDGEVALILDVATLLKAA